MTSLLVTFAMVGGLVHSERVSAAESTDTQAETRTVEGVITDSGNVPLSGATVQLEGTDSYAIADLDGHFTMSGVPFPFLSLPSGTMSFR